MGAPREVNAGTARATAPMIAKLANEVADRVGRGVRTAAEEVGISEGSLSRMDDGTSGLRYLSMSKCQRDGPRRGWSGAIHRSVASPSQRRSHIAKAACTCDQGYARRAAMVG